MYWARAIRALWSSAPKRTELLTENPECFQCKSVVDREKDEAAVGIESALQEDSVPAARVWNSEIMEKMREEMGPNSLLSWRKKTRRALGIEKTNCLLAT